MKIKVTPKTKGNVVNIRQAMSGKGNGVIITTLPDGYEIDATETTNDSWLKVETDDGKGYIRADLVTIIVPETKVETPDDKETEPVSNDESEVKDEEQDN